MSKIERKIANRLAKGSAPGRARANPGRRYRKGRRKTGGRAPGTPNVMTREVKEAIIEGLSRIGSDGKGKDAIVGYVERIGRQDIKSGAMLLRAILPLQVNANVCTNNITRYETVEEIDADLAARGLPPMKDLFQIDFKGDEVADAELVPVW